MNKHSFLMGTAALLLALAPACDLGSGDDPADPGGGTAGTPAGSPAGGGAPAGNPAGNPAGGGGISGAPIPKQLPDGTYERGSMRPLFDLLNQQEFNRFDMFEFLGKPELQASDFQAIGVQTSMEAKMLELERQLSAEFGEQQGSLISGQDATLARVMPFRGNPSDLDFLEVDGDVKIVVPLGGDFTAPGNQISIVNRELQTNNLVEVGIRPQRVAIHEPSQTAFVCNQYSNYISLVDLEDEEVILGQDGNPLEIPTHFYCTDIAVVNRNRISPDDDEIDVYVANQWRSAVLKYSVDLQRNAVQNEVTGLTIIGQPAGAEPHVPTQVFDALGKNPFRLVLSENEDRIYVSNNRGGELGLINIDANTTFKTSITGPTPGIIEVDSQVYVLTTTPFRGLLRQNDNQPNDVQFGEVLTQGVDNQQHQVHPGSMFDDTASYNFEDLRNGIFEFNLNLSDNNPVFFTDNSEGDAEFQDAEKVLDGATPQEAVFNPNTNQLFVAMSSSDQIHVMDVASGAAFSLSDSGIVVPTEERPFALSINLDRNELYVANWGGESVQVFDLNNLQGGALATINAGFAVPDYPANSIERGEYVYYSAKWSNDGDKSCATCHIDELLTDGIGYANGATAPTAFHQVKPNYNLLQTDNYFWNGSFTNNSYASLAFAAQSRVNCEMILFAFVEGPASDPNTRVGDPNIFPDIAINADACRPNTQERDPNFPDLPANFDEAFAQIVLEKQQAAIIMADSVADVLGAGVDREDMSRFSDYYGAGELRLPANALAHMARRGTMDQVVIDAITQGEQLFKGAATCNNCHIAENFRAPFTDNSRHGAGAGWAEQFVLTYDNDPDLKDLDALLNLPGTFANGLSNAIIPFELVESQNTNINADNQEINLHHDPLDFFQPFCFDVNLCFVFRDPLKVTGNADLERQRLQLLARINLADPERTLMPGQPVGATAVDTPSLRGVWLQHNLLRHGLAFSLREAILAPGHPGLGADEQGWSFNSSGSFNAHGSTRDLTPAQVDALVLYLQSIE